MNKATKHVSGFNFDIGTMKEEPKTALLFFQAILLDIKGMEMNKFNIQLHKQATEAVEQLERYIYGQQQR